MAFLVATTSLPAVDRPNADRWNAARSCQKTKNDLLAVKQILYDMGPLTLVRWSLYRALKVWDTLSTRIQAHKGPTTQNNWLLGKIQYLKPKFCCCCFLVENKALLPPPPVEDSTYLF